MKARGCRPAARINRDGACPARGSRQLLAVCQTLLKPSPVLSPGFASFDHVYTGLPLYAHCFVPSSRVIVVQSPDALASVPAASGGQFVAQGPLQALLPPASLSKV